MMKRNDLINIVKGYFNIREIVCPHVYEKFKNNSWQFISTELLHTLYILRTKIINAPMIVNNWSSKGSYSQRGLRCNLCNLVKSKSTVYVSAHCLGKAVDFTVPDKSAEEVRRIIKSNIDKFEYPIRLEEGTSWVHIDCYTLDDSVKLTTFSE